MLTHLSAERFIHLIADYTGEQKYQFKCKEITIILFHKKEHLYDKGFRDVYDELEKTFSNIRTYQVIYDNNPDIIQAYNLEELPATLFIGKNHYYNILYGFLKKEEVMDELKQLELK